ncbi:hypothetical protein L873DRAFT_1820191 [Choiromyces venosus 120613-1]|uniref:Orc1-like AAA ATPase domain-containing protein n=1 Tax=Choiromyces venosus 120613-1 TaxID=1336337 RepID=A0A3N4J1P5_9PEZI|nr:hypothetical protein L873DRAFT_1820191 [Choiromyces venosus 120613-1]
MAARAARIPPCPFPRFYPPCTSFASSFHIHQFPASHLPCSRFQASPLKYFRQGTHRGLSTWGSPTGAVPDVERKATLVERQGATRAIESILKPQSDYARYNMIVGNHGTGKTTLVCHVGHQLDGILYVNISPNSVSDKTFAEEFAKAFHWTPATRFWHDMLLSYWGISAGEVADDRAILVEVFKEFDNQAKVFKKNKGRSPVLVLDNINRLAEANPKLLNILQDMAKDAADDGLFITVFVTSRSASSRLGKVVEIGDMNHDEAIDFLCNKRAISESVAEDIYSLVGGRVGLLVTAVNELDSGQDFAGVRELLLGDARRVLRKGGMEQGGQFREAGIQIANHIFQHGRISWYDFYRISGSTSQGDQLLSLNIFTTAPRSEWVFFDTKPMEITVRALVENASD